MGPPLPHVAARAAEGSAARATAHSGNVLLGIICVPLRARDAAAGQQIAREGSSRGRQPAEGMRTNAPAPSGAQRPCAPATAKRAVATANPYCYCRILFPFILFMFPVRLLTSTTASIAGVEVWE